MITDAVAPFLGRLEQAIDLRTGQEVLLALVRVGRFRPTLYLRLLVAIAACLKSADAIGCLGIALLTHCIKCKKFCARLADQPSRLA